MLKNKKLTIENEDYTGSQALKDWFRSFGLLPTERDLQMVIDMYRKTGEIPVQSSAVNVKFVKTVSTFVRIANCAKSTAQKRR